MKTMTILTGALLLTFATGMETQAQSFNRPRPRQQSRQYRPPVTSPYINLLGSGSDPRAVYLGIVQPQMEQQRFDREQVEDTNRLQQDIRRNEETIAEQGRKQTDQINRIAVGLGLKAKETGIGARFMSRGQYFPRLGN